MSSRAESAGGLESIAAVAIEELMSRLSSELVVGLIMS
eukprot:CAMPEP_0167821266 /NCGR_PEP_ID=MMETSP0112_2-20121227/6682_1 /TAXON_ID=91324 /ORGANISM="Lotharella globosa, Strain CCCM811" /LENGTH=37 /DNA_ID= /DNA_START= /DNA_END= /DNA_ORIENTATION=